MSLDSFLDTPYEYQKMLWEKRDSFTYLRTWEFKWAAQTIYEFYGLIWIRLPCWFKWKRGRIILGGLDTILSPLCRLSVQNFDGMPFQKKALNSRHLSIADENDEMSQSHGCIFKSRNNNYFLKFRFWNWNDFKHSLIQSRWFSPKMSIDFRSNNKKLLYSFIAPLWRSFLNVTDHSIPKNIIVANI